jgi:malonyl-CoA O-methyltransferase
VHNKEKQVSKAVKEFSRFANQYDTYNIIQVEVAKTLIAQLPLKAYSTIVDLGCGSGEVYKNIEKKNISFKQFIALDSSQEMLNIHPSGTKIKKICADFNVSDTFDIFTVGENSIVFSSSALQWSRDLDLTLSRLSKKASKAYFAIFTSSTFKTLHQVAEIKSPIYSEMYLKEMIQKYYQATFETRKYSLHFDSVRDMFKYIKKSGVSGGEKKLSYKQTKHLMKVYPLNYLEFEVLFVKADVL